MKFKSDIEIEAGVAASGSTGSNGQVLSSTGSSVAWINQNAVTSTSDFVFFNVKNETGSTILKGKGVMAVGTNGNSGQILIDEMVADGTVEPKYFLGVLEEDISNGGTARVISFGQLSQFDTRGQNGETWSDGQVLWCDPANNGDFTITEPDGPNLKIAAAFIVNSSTNGKIQVRVQANEGIHDLYDTKITSQVDGDVLVWDNTTGVWFNDSTLNVDYTNGRVGIGTTEPSEKLEVAGNVILDAASTRLKLKGGVAGTNSGIDWTFNTDSTQYARIELDYDTRASTGLLIDSGYPMTLDYSSGSFSVKKNGLSELTILNGNVGIGTTSPGQKLEVVGNIRAKGDDPKIYVTSTAINGRDYSIQSSQFGTFGIYDGTTSRLSITSNGNVGIGTNSPGEKLNVDGNILADSFIKNGGTSNQFLKADGSVDTISYASVGNTYNKTQSDSIFASKTLSKNISFGESYASNFRSRSLDNGATFFPRPLGYEIGLMKEQNLFQKARLSLLPSAVGTNKLFNIKPKNDTFDFSRASTATYVDEDGLIQVADSNVPRLNYPLIDGAVSGCPSLLLEPQRSNNLQRSQEFDNLVWGKDASVTITQNYSISPDGTQNAERFEKTATGGNEGITQNIFGLSAGTYTLTFYIKSNTDANQNARLLYGGFQSSSILITPNWQRFEITYTANTSVDYNGILSNEALDISIWGAQLEQGSYATSYIPTSGYQTTRSAETCNNAGDVNTFNDSEGVLMAEISALDETMRISLNDGTANNNVRLVYNSSTKRIDGFLFNGTNQASLAYTLPIEGGFNKIAFKYKENDFALWVDGIEVDSQVGNGITFTSGTLSELDFDAGNGLVPFYGSAKQIQYFDTALTDTELQQLTS